MTSVLLVKASERIVAVADGRLSLDDGTVSFDSTAKIRLFTPKYLIPRSSMGRINCFSDYIGHDWCLSYSGTYALASQISEVFVKTVTGLYLARRDDGTPVLQHEFDTSGSFSEDYNFDHNEKPKITSRVIIGEFKQAFQSKCDEWSRNRGFPDCQFLLFGTNEETEQYSAFKIFADEAGWHPGDSIRIVADEVRDGELAAIGSPEVGGNAYEDHELQDGLEGWKNDQMEAEIARAFDTSKSTEPLSPARNWGLTQIKERLSQIIRAASDPSIGKNLTIASGAWGSRIKLETA